MFDQSVNQPVFLFIKNKVIYIYYKGKTKSPCLSASFWSYCTPLKEKKLEG